VQTCNSACSFVWVRNFVSELREGYGLRVFGNMVLRRIFGQEKGVARENCINMSFITCSPRKYN
jgi:hypothetical protein